MSLPPLEIEQILHRYHLRPDKSLGQNFLVNQAALLEVVETAEIQAQDMVLEVGPGLGSLTRELAIRAGKVTAVELDTRLIPALQEVLASFENVQIIQGDILKLDPARLISQAESQNYKVAANIPYNITSVLIRHLLEAGKKPTRMVLTVQNEVAERICARPGEMSLLALSVQVYGAASIVARIPAEAFYPPPKVDSAVTRIDLYETPVIPIPLLPLFFRLAKAGFSQKRKMLRNTLAGGMHWPSAQAEAFLEQAGIASSRRAETLAIEEWGKLAEVASQATGV